VLAGWSLLAGWLGGAGWLVGHWCVFCDGRLGCAFCVQGYWGGVGGCWVGG